jgi:hypothetical protein
MSNRTCNYMNNDDRNERRTRQAVPFQSKELATHNQVDILLRITDSVAGNLRARVINMDTGTDHTPDMDGGTKMALESTLIRTMNALDRIVDDVERFSIKVHEDTQKQAIKVMEAHEAFFRAQERAAAHITRPCVQFPVTIAAVRDGTWACFLGELETQHAIVGQGATPELAREAFDQAFAGQTPQRVLDWANKVTNETKPKETNENQLDAGTDKSDAGTPPSGKNSHSNRKPHGPGSVSGAKQARQNRKRNGKSGFGSGPQSPS